MNILAALHDILEPVVRENGDIDINDANGVVVDSIPEEYWADREAREYLFKPHTRKMLNSLGCRSIRRRSSETGDMGRGYEQRKMWDEPAYQDAIDQYAERADANYKIAVSLYNEGIEKGYQLTLPGINL